MVIIHRDVLILENRSKALSLVGAALQTVQRIAFDVRLEALIRAQQVFDQDSLGS